MRVSKQVFWELALVLASILIFRSAWTLLDRLTIMNLESGLWASLILGLVVALVSLLALNECILKQKSDD